MTRIKKIGAALPREDCEGPWHRTLERTCVSCVACHTPRHAPCGTCPRKRYSKDRVRYKKVFSRLLCSKKRVAYMEMKSVYCLLAGVRITQSLWPAWPAWCLSRSISHHSSAHSTHDRRQRMERFLDDPGHEPQRQHGLPLHRSGCKHQA